MDCRLIPSSFDQPTFGILSGGGFPRVFSSAGDRSRRIFMFCPLCFALWLRLIRSRVISEHSKSGTKDPSTPASPALTPSSASSQHQPQDPSATLRTTKRSTGPQTRGSLLRSGWSEVCVMKLLLVSTSPDHAIFSGPNTPFFSMLYSLDLRAPMGAIPRRNVSTNVLAAVLFAPMSVFAPAKSE